MANAVKGYRRMAASKARKLYLGSCLQRHDSSTTTTLWAAISHFVKKQRSYWPIADIGYVLRYLEIVVLSLAFTYASVTSCKQPFLR